MIANAVTNSSGLIPNLYYLGAIFFGLFAAAGYISRSLSKKINNIVPDNPTIKELRLEIQEVKKLVYEVKANGLPNGGSSMRDDIKAVAKEVSEVKSEVAEHRGILDGIRLHFST